MHSTNNPFLDNNIIRGFNARDSDVIIVTAPKSGTTWLQQILYQMRSGGDDAFACLDSEVPWLEVPRPGVIWRQQLASFDAMPAARIFKSHCPHPLLQSANRSRFVFCCRDPRDCCVSFYHHALNMTDEAIAYFGLVRPASFDQFFKTWIHQADWFNIVASWWPHRLQSNILWLHYRDMLADLPATIDQLQQFLGWDINPFRRNKIIEHSTFSWMKAHNRRFGSLSGQTWPFFKPGTFIRRGGNGDYDGLLAPRHERIIRQTAREFLTPDCLDYFGLTAASPTRSAPATEPSHWRQRQSP